MRLPSKNSGGAAAIAVQLQQAILEGSYHFGERLPAERELAEHFGASRSTVREALKRLEDRQLVTRRVGSGTFVNHGSVLEGADIAEVTSPLELIEVRLALEPRIAGLAAVKATAKDLQGIERVLVDLEAAGPDRESFSLADERFHLTIVECTHNPPPPPPPPLMIWLYRKINDVRTHSQWARMKEAILTPARIAEYNSQHRALFEALRSHDAERSIAVIESHLQRARTDLIGVGNGP